MPVLTIDAGTTGITVLVIDADAHVAGRAYREFPQHFPRPGWVEHDPDEIWDATVEAAQAALADADVRVNDCDCVGITNQRETAVLWDRASLRPVARAIVWQDRRTARRCDELRASGRADAVRRRTGLVLDPYFTGTKLAWLLDEVDGARAAAEEGRLAGGTVDTWLIAKLTAGERHVTEPSNASRTMLYDIREGRWDGDLCDLLRVPPSVLAEVRPSSGELGVTDPDAFLGARLPITGVAGDQQAALFGQGCWDPGLCKNTYGTGSFVLQNAGPEAPVSEDLLTTVAWRLGERTTYALEGSIFITGAAIQWLRDGLGLLDDAAETEGLAASVRHTDDVFLIPAFAGLGAPHWDPYARGTIVGLTRGTTRAHVVRAAVEAMAYQTRDVIEVMQRDAEVPVEELRVDGGASVMDLLCQFQADLLQVPVLRPDLPETTALGAAYLAGLGAGVWGSLDELRETWRLDRRFEPPISVDEADARQSRWRDALRRSLSWARD